MKIADLFAYLLLQGYIGYSQAGVARFYWGDKKYNTVVDEVDGQSKVAFDAVHVLAREDELKGKKISEECYMIPQFEGTGITADGEPTNVLRLSYEVEEDLRQEGSSKWMHNWASRPEMGSSHKLFEPTPLGIALYLDTSCGEGSKKSEPYLSLFFGKSMDTSKVKPIAAGLYDLAQVAKVEGSKFSNHLADGNNFAKQYRSFRMIDSWASRAEMPGKSWFTKSQYWAEWYALPSKIKGGMWLNIIEGLSSSSEDTKKMIKTSKNGDLPS